VVITRSVSPGPGPALCNDHTTVNVSGTDDGGGHYTVSEPWPWASPV